MSDGDLKVSVIVATYQPGDGLDRVIGSIDRQTLPQDEFEVVFVDDGSSDDTYARLQRLKVERPNVRVLRIENSGWPGRPRNIGIAEARGEYVMFMDHDDSLFPDALRRCYEYAVETGADLLSPKESKTNDVWWMMSSVADGNLSNVRGAGGIRKILPMVPHKFYRRQILIDHDLRFPEGPRALWEDIFINVGVYRHAKVVSVLADTPVYLWHLSDSNSSYGFDPARRDFWDRLEDVMAFIDRTLDAPEFVDDRAAALAHQLQVRAIDRMVRYTSKSDPTISDVRRLATWLVKRKRSALRADLRRLRAFHRARGMLRRFGGHEVLAAMPRKHRIQAELLRMGRRDLMVAVREWDAKAGPKTTVHAMRWRDGRLNIEFESIWDSLDGDAAVLRREGDEVLLALPVGVREALPRELVDATSLLKSEFSVEIIARDRHEDVSWTVPVTALSAAFEDTEDGRVRIVGTGTAEIDIETMGGGAPLKESLWDLRVKTSWCGMSRRRGLSYGGGARVGLVQGRPAVAYRNTTSSISLDLVGEARTAASDAAPVAGPAGTAERFAVRLKNLVSDRDVTVPVNNLYVVPSIALGRTSGKAESFAAEKFAMPLAAQIVVEGNEPRLVGTLDVEQGVYRVFTRRAGRLYRTRHSIVVDADGQLEWVAKVQ